MRSVKVPRTVRDTLIGAALGAAAVGAVFVPRLTEVGRVSAIMRGETRAYGDLHVTRGTVQDSPHMLLSLPTRYLAGLDSVLEHDRDYQRLMMLGLQQGPRLDFGSGIRYGDQRIRAIVPVLHQPDVVYVATEGFFVERGQWPHITGILEHPESHEQ